MLETKKTPKDRYLKMIKKKTGQRMKENEKKQSYVVAHSTSTLYTGQEPSDHRSANIQHISLWPASRQMLC